MDSSPVANDLLRRLRVERENRESQRKQSDTDLLALQAHTPIISLNKTSRSDNSSVFNPLSAQSRDSSAKKNAPDGRSRFLDASGNTVDSTEKSGNASMVMADFQQQNIDHQLAVTIEQEDIWTDTFEDWTLSTGIPALSETSSAIPAPTDEDVAPDAHEVHWKFVQCLD